MPSTQTKPAAAKGAPQTTTEKPQRSIGETLHKSLQGDLEEHLEKFMKRAWFEEKNFLNEVLRDWNDNTGGGYPKERDAREVPLFSAIEWQLSGYNCVSCPDYLVEDVEKFIDSKDEGRPKHHDQTSLERSQVEQRRLERLRIEIEDFRSRASFDDIYYLLDILNRYRGIMDYAVEDRPDEILRSAAQQAIDDRWLVKVDYDYIGPARTLLALLGKNTWLNEFVRWIASTHEDNPEALTPCAVAAEAQKRQKQFDADIKKARALTKGYPTLVVA